MGGKLLLASALTIFFLLSVVGLVVAGVLYFFGGADLLTVITFTVLFNVVAFFVSPWVQDFLLKWLHGAKFYTVDEFKSVAPEVSEIIERVSREHGFRPPKIVYIPDKNPTAFTYGSTRSRARIAITEGILEYLEPDERRAVIAHELGHIVHYDFAVMAVATTLLQILYEVYVWSRNAGGMRKKTHEKELEEIKRARRRDRGGIVPLLIIAAISYVFYIIGRYIVLYLSRVREYYADEFAAKKTSPTALASALVKVAYGIVEAPDDYESRRLLRSTEALGIMNERVARAGVAFSGVLRGSLYRLNKAVAWDLYSPWAFLLELGSTHPLTGKRIVRLLEMTGRPVHVPKPDMGEIYRRFATDILSYSAYIVFPVIGVIVAVLIVSTMSGENTLGMEVFGGICAGLGAAVYFRKTYKYPGGKAEYTTIAKLLEDPYASPMRGKRVVFNGKVVGRGIPNQLFCEDVIVKDNTGIITANYESPLLDLGNMFFAVTKVDSLIGKDVRIEGWYFRGVAPRIDLHRITNGETIKSCPYNIQIYSAIALFALGILLIAMSL